MFSHLQLTLLCVLWGMGCLGQEANTPSPSPAAVDPPTPGPGTPRPPDDSSAGKHLPKCTLHILDFDLKEYVNEEVKESGAVLFEIHVNMANYSVDPLRTEVSQHYKPWLWHMTRSRHGRTLLMLSFHYDVLSMNILKMGVNKVHLQVADKPHGCMASLDIDGRVVALRSLLLSQGGSGTEFACTQLIRRAGSTGEFVHNCCHNDSTTRTIVCQDQMDDVWISTLYIAVAIIKVMAFCFCPLVLPSSMYSAVYVASEYVVKLKREVKMKLFISEQVDCPVKYKRRLTLEDVSSWRRFREAIDTLPYDEVIPIKMTELRIKVKGKRIIPENEPPTGLMRTLFDNLIRCKLKRLDPFTDCCESSVFAAMAPKFRHKLSWFKCVQAFVSVLMLFLIPFPYYVRLIIFYKFEYNEVADRRAAMSRLGLSEAFLFYKTNVMQYFTPTHGVFVAAYCLYFLAGLFIGFSEYGVREKLKAITRSSMQDMANVSQVSVLSVLIRVCLWPFKKCGLLALLLAPLYTCLALPFCSVVFVLYCIPTIYLSYRLLLHSHRQFGNVWVEENEERRKRFRRLQQLSKRLSRMDKTVHRVKEEDTDSGCLPSCPKGEHCSFLRSLCLQVASGAFCLCVLYALALIFAESFSLLVEVIAFTLMGIIVNAGRTLKYVTMVVLVFVYMHDCYNNVYETYLDFNKTVLEEIVGRVDDDLRKHASLPSSMQENAAFQARAVDDDIYVPTTLSIKKRAIRWRVGHLMLFLDSFDTPRIPLRFFEKACEIRIHGAPGPVFLSLIGATGRFLIIVIFLLFVMIVVMAFGNVTEMSSTNQTMATLAGGFVPMLLKNVLSSKGKKLSLKTVSFKGQIDEILGEYKQHWPVTDMVFQQYDPEEEAEKEKENEENKDGEDKKKDGDKKKSEGRKDSRVEEGEKTTKVGLAETKDQNANDSGVVKVDMNGPLLGAQAEEAVLAAGEGSTVQLSDSVLRFSSKPLEVTGSQADLLGPSTSPPEEEDMVDVFLDLSVAEAGMWSIHNSMESLPRPPGFMPDYFRPAQQPQPDSPV